MSFIYRRNKIYWYCTSIKGRRICHSLHTTNKRTAQQLRQELDEKYIRVKLNLRHIENITLQEYFQKYCRVIDAIKNPSWGSRILVMLTNFMNFAQNRAKTLQEIDFNLIKDFILTRQQNGASAKTMREELGIIRRFLTEAVQDNYLAECSIDFRRLQNEYCQNGRKNHFPPFTTQELELIFNSGSPDVPFFKVLYYTGLRRSDVGSLRQSNLDRKRKCIQIVTQKEAVPTLIPVHPAIEFIFKLKTEYLFPDYNTEAKQDAARKRLKRLARKLGINPECNLHSFRHTFNQRLLELGLNYMDRQKLLAHSSSRTTQDYTHTDLELTRRYIEKL